jgi:2Fe-2S ferredoxin
MDAGSGDADRRVRLDYLSPGRQNGLSTVGGLSRMADFMALIRVTDQDGTEHEVQGNTGFTLMENLRELEYGVAAICGGMMACATCHVWVDPQWLDKLPPQQSDELEMVRELSTYRSNSRLSCQIKFTEQLSGIALRIADDE